MEQKPVTLEVVRSVIQLLGCKEALVESDLNDGQSAFLVLSRFNEDKEMTFRTFADTGNILYARFPYFNLTQREHDIGQYLWVVLFNPKPETDTTEVKAVKGFNFIAKFLSAYVHGPKPMMESNTALKLAFVGMLTLLGLPSSEIDIYKARLRKLYRKAQAHDIVFGGMPNTFSQEEFWRRSEMSEAESAAIAKKFNGGGGDELPSAADVSKVYTDHFLPSSSLRKMVTDADVVFITAKAPQDSNSRDDLKLVIHKPRLPSLGGAKFEFKPFDRKTKLD